MESTRNPNDTIVRISKLANLTNYVVFRGIHLVALTVFLTSMNWRSFVIAFTLYWGRMFVITAGYHRYFSHRAYKTSRLVQFIIGFLGTTCIQKGPLWWAATHRRHHKYTDEPQDVHSPRQRGWWYAHIGWLGNPENGNTDLRLIPDLVRFRELRWLDRYHWVAPLLTAFACFTIAGWQGVSAMAISTVLFWHATFAINSVAHLYGNQPFPQTRDDSRNWWLLALLTMGEGWHNNHHFDQNSARQGFRRWWEIDLSYYLLSMLAKAKIVWGLRQPSPKTREAMRRQ